MQMRPINQSTQKKSEGAQTVTMIPNRRERCGGTPLYQCARVKAYITMY